MTFEELLKMLRAVGPNGSVSLPWNLALALAEEVERLRGIVEAAHVPSAPPMYLDPLEESKSPGAISTLSGMPVYNPNGHSFPVCGNVESVDLGNGQICEVQYCRCYLDKSAGTYSMAINYRMAGEAEFKMVYDGHLQEPVLKDNRIAVTWHPDSEVPIEIASIEPTEGEEWVPIRHIKDDSIWILKGLDSLEEAEPTEGDKLMQFFKEGS